MHSYVRVKTKTPPSTSAAPSSIVGVIVSPSATTPRPAAVACRGGETRSRPFWTGASLNASQANFNGSRPYAGEATDARGTTLRGLAARASINKSDYGIKGNPLEPNVGEKIGRS